MKAVIAVVVLALGGAVAAPAWAKPPPERKEVKITAAFVRFTLAGVMLDGIDGTSEHYDVLDFRVQSPDALRDRTFAVWVRIPLVVVKDETASERQAYWTARIGRQLTISLDERVFSEPDLFPCAFACSRDSLKLERPPNPESRVPR